MNPADAQKIGIYLAEIAKQLVELNKNVAQLVAPQRSEQVRKQSKVG